MSQLTQSSSIFMLQLLSIPSQMSRAAGLTLALQSSQSSPGGLLATAPHAD
jgi:hypothetical protein